MPKIVILDGYTENPGDLSWGGFEALGELTVYDRTAPGDVVSRIGDAEVVFTNKALLLRDAIFACPNLKFIGVLATGNNVVDVAAAKDKGVLVANIPAYSTPSVAQLVFALLLEICHHAQRHSDAVHEGRWTNSPDFCFWDYPLIELKDKVLGLVGFGRIGQAVARIGAALGMKPIAFSRTETEEGRVLAKYVSLEELYARSDVISLHCPLTEETRGMINRDSIAKMKPGVILINTGRGPLIAEQDLAETLNTGRVYAAGVDVVSEEPIRADNPLLNAKNCLITPHIAWAPRESRQRLMDIAVDNLRQFLAGTPVNIVNY
jgi:glycerate dehydrogenase